MSIPFQTRVAFALAFIIAVFANDAKALGEDALETPKMTVAIDGETILPSFGTVAGCWFYHSGETGSQVLLLGFPECGLDRKPHYRAVLELTPCSTVQFALPAEQLENVCVVSCNVDYLSQDAKPTIAWSRPDASAELSASDADANRVIARFKPERKPLLLAVSAPQFDPATTSCAVALDNFIYETAPVQNNLSLEPTRKKQSLDPIETSPNFKPALADALVEWDWRMQDGINVERKPRCYMDAIQERLPQGRALLADLHKTIDDDAYDALLPYDPEIAERFDAIKDRLDEWDDSWFALEKEYKTLIGAPDDAQAEALWRKMRVLRREILLNAPYFQFSKLLFVKHAPSIMSHQLTQVYGYCARPGGGVFLLENPGKSMMARDVTPENLKLGSYMTPELSFDAKDLYFSYCELDSTPKVWRDPDAYGRRYHLYKASLENLDQPNAKLNARQLTDGDYDDFAPILLPDSDLVFSSTRRGGFHRCGGGPCYVYTLARAKNNGDDPRPISFHETNEWFPTLAHNGRIIYTRWDYVDRDAVYYQQLWSTRQDGTDVRIAYGNNTFNPPGFWEPKAVPGSDKIMAVGGPHHGMSAGSVVLIDLNKGVDGPEPVERLTPETLYPEGEAPLPLIPQLPELCDFDYVPANFWQAGRPAERAKETIESQRWPVHCYKSPYPLSEKYFVASFSYDKLTGEAGPNIPNQFGIYYCDAFGNRELIYRDPNISSLWAIPVRQRPVPPVVASTLDESRQDPQRPTGTFFLQNVYESWPNKIPAKIKALRIVQVLPKTTPNANQPMVGAANASPGKQVLGTVPVEEDGSAFFEAPAKTPILFQALDEEGRMVQGMRSLVYLQPGESAGCVGCHEDRMASAPSVKTIASTKEPAKITPGPDGSKPFSYPILVQPVLDAKCVACHNSEKAEGNVNLTSELDGTYTKSYNALIPRVAYTYWGAPEGNHEPYTEPDRFGARASALVKLLQKGHYDVELTPEEWERINTWIDANALFYGTFKPEDQARQQRGERIEGPELE